MSSTCKKCGQRVPGPYIHAKMKAYECRTMNPSAVFEMSKLNATCCAKTPAGAAAFAATQLGKKAYQHSTTYIEVTPSMGGESTRFKITFPGNRAKAHPING